MKIPFMQTEKNEEIVMVDINKIHSNPYQPRNNFNDDDLQDLAESIKNFGVIQPITLRTRGEGFELIAGERRLKASKYLGYEKVPAVIKDFSDQEAAEIALVENLQRKDLDFIEEALAYSRLLNEFTLTQKELADKLGKSQSTIANKLRILNLPEEVLQELKNPAFSERHARALLKLTDKSKQLEIINEIIKKELNVRETEKLINSLLVEKEKPKKVVTIYKDLRIFTNTLNKTIKEMEAAGLEVKVKKNEVAEYIEYNIRLPRK